MVDQVLNVLEVYPGDRPAAERRDDMGSDQPDVVTDALGLATDPLATGDPLSQELLQGVGVCVGGLFQLSLALAALNRLRPHQGGGVDALPGTVGQ